MMKRVKLSTCAKWLALGLLVVVNSSYAASRVKTAAQAIQCQPDTQENGYNGTCPYPADLYRADPVWKKDMESALQKAGSRRAGNGSFSYTSLASKKQVRRDIL